MRQNLSQMKYEIADIEDALRMEVQQITKREDEIADKLEELYKIHNERKNVVNLPVNFESNKSGKAGKASGLDPELILDALEKMRDYIAAENKKMREEFFKLTMEFEGKVREKIDKRDLDDIESKRFFFHHNREIN